MFVFNRDLRYMRWTIDTIALNSAMLFSAIVSMAGRTSTSMRMPGKSLLRNGLSN